MQEEYEEEEQVKEQHKPGEPGHTDWRKTPLADNIHYFMKWTFISVIIGVTVGVVGAVFGHGVILATRLWQQFHWTVFFMPVAGKQKGSER